MFWFLCFCDFVSDRAAATGNHSPCRALGESHRRSVRFRAAKRMHISSGLFSLINPLPASFLPNHQDYAIADTDQVYCKGTQKFLTA
jgi:hypothetical protein